MMKRITKQSWQLITLDRMEVREKKNNQGKRITLDRKEVRAKKNNQGKLTIDT